MGTRDELDNLFIATDVNQDGCVDFAEFVGFIFLGGEVQDAVADAMPPMEDVDDDHTGMQAHSHDASQPTDDGNGANIALSESRQEVDRVGTGRCQLPVNTVDLNESVGSMLFVNGPNKK